jgi:HlyD family secretion protein
MAGDRAGAVIEQLRTLFNVGVVGDLSDGHLLDLFVTRQDEAAFAALIERHGPMVLRVCRQVLGDSHDAQDAAQAVFIALARKARSIRTSASVASWLHGVAVRVAAKAKTAAARRRGHERRAGETRARAGTNHVATDDPAWPELHEELGQLPAPRRHRQSIRPPPTTPKAGYASRGSAPIVSSWFCSKGRESNRDPRSSLPGRVRRCR